MKFVALSGGIGSGKSTVATALAERGADVIDVDRLSREIQRPGHPVFDAIVERWGRRILTPEGELDRPALGRIVFADAAELAVLTRDITGPAIEVEIIERASRHLGTDGVVILEAPLLLGGDRRIYGLEGVIVVDVPVGTAVARLVQQRGMDKADVMARVGKQLDPQQRLGHADFVIDNSAERERLTPQVEAAWRWIGALPDAVPVRSHGTGGDRQKAPENPG